MSGPPLPSASVEDVLAAIDVFRQLVAAELRNELKLTDLYRVRSGTCGLVHWPECYDKVWRTNQLAAGVYMHFNDEDQLLYVGKATSIGNRLAAYFKNANFPIDKTCTIIDPALHASIGVRSVLMNGKLRFLTPALECFLIETLNPPVNKQGRTNL